MKFKSTLSLLLLVTVANILTACGDIQDVFETNPNEFCLAFEPSAAIASPNIDGYEIDNTSTWHIYNQDGLRAFANHVNGVVVVDNASSDVILMNDITLSGAWTPIGSEAVPYNGIFDGDNKSISGVVVNSSSNYQGFFGVMGNDGDTVIKDVAFVGARVTGVNNAGIVAGRINGNAIIDNVRAIGGSVSASGDDVSIGGIVGVNFAREIRNSCNSGGVSTNSESASIGGIAGSSGSTIITSYNTADINSNAMNIVVGGITGQSFSGGHVVGSYNLGDISGRNGTVGGIIGKNVFRVTASYNHGKITGVRNAGGIAGENQGIITSCYNVANVVATTSYGALVGFNNGNFGRLDGSNYFIRYGVLSALGTGFSNTAFILRNVKELNESIDEMNFGISQDLNVQYIQGSPDINLNPPTIM